jgi:hypothetical protein
MALPRLSTTSNAPLSNAKDIEVVMIVRGTLKDFLGSFDVHSNSHS